jgi:DNA repair ATPase RecN
VDEETEYLINMNQELQSAIKQMEFDFSQLSNDKQNLERQLSGLKRQYEKEQDQIAKYIAQKDAKIKSLIRDTSDL